LKFKDIFKEEYNKYGLSKNIVIIIFGLILSSSFSIAAFNLNNILAPFGGLNIGSFYLKYFAFIDAIIYFVLFLSLSQMVFTRIYSEGSKLISVAIALALTVSMAVLEMRTGFNVGQLSPIALIIFLFIIAILLFNLFLGLFTGENGKSVSATLTYLIIYGLLNAPFATLNKWIEQNTPFLLAILALAAVAAFIYLILELFKALGFKKNSTPVQGATGAQGPPGERGPQGNTNEQPIPETNAPKNNILPNNSLPNQNLPNNNLPNNITPRPPGPRPSPTPKNRHPNDPKTNPQKVQPGIMPEPEPNIPIIPQKPKIPETETIFIDLSKEFNPIRSQGNIGACAGFAASATLEYMLKSRELSPLYNYYKFRELNNSINTDSGSRTSCIIASLENKGTCFEYLWPYDISKFTQKPPGQADIDAMQKRVSQIYRINKNDPDQFVYQLAEKNPLIILIHCPKELHTQSSSLYHNPNPQLGGGHAMVLVGYHSHYPILNSDSKTPSGIKAFKIRNSWDTDWAENGYVWISAETLTKILMNDPIVIKGHKSSDIIHTPFKITGRVVFDSQDKRITPEHTGYQIFSNDNWPNPIPDNNDPYYVGAMIQSHGQLKGLKEIKVTDNKGRFTLEFNANPLEFEPLTELNGKFSEFNNIHFKNLPAGIIVYKRHAKDSSDKEWFFHIIDFKYSFGGRGGLGSTNENNPMSQNKDNHEQNCSGIPITFSPKHTHEMNVIIPVPIFDKL
jgi:hypothetical protein